ncbi:MAG TPA: ATP synthase F1 subunit delta [Flavobacteriaceae bacterium]|jgi:F-type H+-transporting ATPase subunit delta|nr:ATP synthase F1 subunit delta [Flavobacteriaceae bacterium]MAY53306.1 ATP synthase F1 subunit delta [Flavobacteriaceae bacterium]HBR53350.1 ATP synthase F1 subunit delta [Flavobacteriaceae bacterium]HIB47497.1 ATP synthase F1 subunit delta [Flavobacteriaceae bacterium]HIN98983.1 ATP synthase F1 subunit delta [Flavobacteriaceae bacterium]|tara:strand:- start:97087 stop:97626 length:540 start_codon:yes stop_codon:yes gene_type:complete
MSSRAAIRYAKAVLEQANEAKLGNVVFGDMKSVAATIENSKELRAVLNSPVIKGEDKKKALMAIFEGNSEVTKGVIDILDSNKRINLLGAVAESYVSLYNEAQGVKVAHVTTAVPLSSELETKVLAKVKEMTGSDSVTIENTIDESIIGGFILRVGDLQYNASIANQLDSIKREFTKSL